jgi:MYXO-CTERM domain-containing protein
MRWAVEAPRLAHPGAGGNLHGMRSSLRALIPFGSLLVGCFASTAAAQELRFSETAPGGITATGNTLGLSKQENLNGPGIRDSIGTFLTLGNGSDDMPQNLANPWPPGTTYDWQQNGSSAVLTLPTETTVLYAELLWGGSFQYGTEDVTAFLDNPVTLTAGGNSLQVTPDPATELTVSSVAASGFLVRYYMRSADVTAFVANAGSGMYSVEGVPATQDASINSLNAAGWTLVVAYRDETAATRNLSVFVGGSFVDEDSQQDYSVSGFCAPPSGDVTGTAIVSTIEGDANLTGDQLLIAPMAAGPFVQLSAPNNPANNFFCSQMNDSKGMLDPQGTFGMANHDAIAGANISGGRQGWDVTAVPLTSKSGQLFTGQKSAVLRTITTGDSYMPILAAFVIDVNAPQFGMQNSTITAEPSMVTLGDTFKVTASLTNGGGVAAENVTFKLPYSNALSLVSVTTDGVPGDVNGAMVDGAALAAGIDQGKITPGNTRQVAVTFHVDTAPANNKIFNLATWSYGFQACAGDPLLDEKLSRSTVVDYEGPATGGSGGSSGSGGSGGSGGPGGSGGSTGGSMGGGTAGSGGSGGPGGTAGSGGADGGAGSGGAGGGGAGGGGDTQSSGGCGCYTAGDSGQAALWPLAAVLLLGARRRRRSAG